MFFPDLLPLLYVDLRIFRGRCVRLIGVNVMAGESAQWGGASRRRCLRRIPERRVGPPVRSGRCQLRNVAHFFTRGVLYEEIDSSHQAVSRVPLDEEIHQGLPTSDSGNAVVFGNE